MKEKNKLKFISIQSKVSPDTAARIDRIVKRCDFGSRYELMQYLLSAFLKYADKEGEEEEVNPELYEFAKIFEGFENKKNRIITTKPGGNKALKMTDSINIFTMIGRKGYICKKISIDGEEVHTTTSNERTLVTVIRKLFPQLATEIDNIGSNIGESSFVKIIQELIEQNKSSCNDKIVKEITVEFESAKQSTEYGNIPKRSRKQTINKL